MQQWIYGWTLRPLRNEYEFAFAGHGHFCRETPISEYAAELIAREYAIDKFVGWIKKGYALHIDYVEKVEDL